jgi:hypothetical protein
MKYYWVISIESNKISEIPEQMEFLKSCFQMASDMHKPLEQASTKNQHGKVECNILKRPYDGQLKLDI